MINYNFLVVAGEASGDLLAKEVLLELALYIKFDIWGTGGPNLKQIGQKQISDINKMAVIGFDGAIKKIPFLCNLSKQIIDQISLKKPDLVILVDYTGFNLRLAIKIKKLFPEIKIVELVAPQLWVWKESRSEILKKYFNLILCTIPFEEKYLKSLGVNSIYIGNPAVYSIKPSFKTRDDFLANFNFSDKRLVIGLVPGSRKKEVELLLPIMLETTTFFPEAQYVIAKSSSLSEEIYKKILLNRNISVVDNASKDIMKYSDLLWICSGTASLEAAVFSTPMVIMYKTSFINFLIIKLFTKLRMIGLPNIIYERVYGKVGENKTIVPEIYGSNCNSSTLTDCTNKLLLSLNYYREKLNSISDLFKEENPVKNSVAPILSLLYDNDATRLNNYIKN